MRLDAIQKEYEKLNISLAQLEADRGQLDSKLKVEKREAFKADEETNKLEKARSEQDTIVDRLNS